MKVLIVEDEKPAANRLQQLLQKQRPQADILGQIDSVESAARWLGENPGPDLLFLDIQLADGLSFDIFREVEVQAPVIFTTAYDQYTLRAFKLNSIDYLLKPIDPEELERALSKFDRFFGKAPLLNARALESLIQSFQAPEYKERFIVKIGQQLTYIQADDVHYFYSEDGLLFARMKDKKRHALDYTLDQLEGLLNPRMFFRLNRKAIAHIHAVHKVSPYFNSRLVVELKPRPDFEVIVSRDRVGDFKNWLDK
ncbi:MAG: response regulator transcription factor [Phaeodactylibacter sp.]|nr:response regulator transcription factor [Myxococcales bacterium]MCB0581793.1 response regulator transcription factor [Phaeodactylibacter sp.]MCB9295465.1 response regulator transcription factor [Lewinellaceae bacterium]